jgi:hypothetical protein
MIASQTHAQHTHPPSGKQFQPFSNGSAYTSHTSPGMMFAFQVGGCIHRQQFTIAHDADAFAVFGFVHVVRGDQDRHTVSASS